MKRRFLLGSIGVWLLSLRSFASEKSVNHSETMKTPDGLIPLQPGVNYRLPQNPQDGTKLVFVPDGKWEVNPPHIRAGNTKIMGFNDDMQLDVSAKFTLIYKKNEGWSLA